MFKVAPSILAVWEKSGHDVEAVVAAAVAAEASGADWIHVDVMDGRYVPQLTFGAEMVEALKKRVSIPLDVHLMMEEPGEQMLDYVKAGASRIVFHPSASRNPKGRLELLKEAGVVAGLALNVGETVDLLEPYAKEVAQVLIMTVPAGAGGQAFLPSMLEKVKEVKALVGAEVPVLVDGGINAETAIMARNAGADGVVAGSFVFRESDYGKAIEILRGKLHL